MKTDALKDLCLCYLDGDLNDEELKAFDDLIAESNQAARMLARLAINDSHFELATTLASDPRQQHGASDHLLDELLRSEQRAAVDWSLLATPAQTQPKHAEVDHLSFKATVRLLGQVSLASIETRHVKWLASAAAILLAAVIAWQVWGPSASPEGQARFTDQTPVEEPQPAHVATLTAERDAVWAEGALAPGSPLRAGQRFTLTEGFAEITTRRGAVAILQAPATIELLDNDNAIHLHSGKMVGVCETESSKGFLVRTPSADIIDLGTEFGVEVESNLNTLTQVFEGEVMLDSAGGRLEDVMLAKGDTVVVDPQGQARQVEQAALSFVRAEMFEKLAGPDLAAYARWLDYRDAFKKMPGLIAYYPIGQESQADSMVYNLAPRTGAALHGRLGSEDIKAQAPQWTTGRIPGKPALSFNNAQPSAVVVPDDDTFDELDEMTLIAWVRPHYVQDPATHNTALPILGKRESLSGRITLQLALISPNSPPPRTPPGTIQFATALEGNSGDAELEMVVHSKQALPPSGEWVHIAVVADRNQSRFYCNGRLVGEGRGLMPVRNRAPLLIGATNHSRETEGDEPLAFNGEIDEVAVFERQLSPDEVQALWLGSRLPQATEGVFHDEN